MATLQAIKYNDGHLEILDRLLLLESCVYIPIHNEHAWGAIREMKVNYFYREYCWILCDFTTFCNQVRGAPAIAIVGSLSLAVELRKLAAPETKKDLHSLVKEKLDYLVTSGPTAVNMQLAAEACIKLSNNLVDKDSAHAVEAKDVVTCNNDVVTRCCVHLEATLANDIADNLYRWTKKMEDNLASFFSTFQKITSLFFSVFTHSLAVFRFELKSLYTNKWMAKTLLTLEISLYSIP